MRRSGVWPGRAVWLVLAALMAPGAVMAQGRGPDQERRAELERQIRHRFLASVAERLELTAEQREGVRDVMAEGAQARVDLMRESHRLRVELMQAVRDEDTPMARYEEILEGLEALRTRERAIEEREEAALAEFLDPRQRAVFLMMRMQFNDRVRQMRGMRGEGPPGIQGGPGGSGGAAGPGGPGGPGPGPLHPAPVL